MAIYGYTKNYKLIKPQFDTDTWHDYIYDNLDTIDAVLSAIFASGNWQGFWKYNTHYDVGGVVIDRATDTMYKVMVEHTTSEATFAEEFAAHPTYYELWSPNNLAESWAIKMDDKVSNEDYSSKAYAISSGLIDDGSAKEWAIKSGTIGTTGEYSAKKYATDAHNDYISMTTDANVVAVGTNIANVNTVSTSISEVNTTASNIASVNTVAGDINRVNLVADDISSVHTVAIDISNVINVAANKTNIDTIAGISTDVTTVASIANAVSNVSGIESEVLDVSDNRTDISTVASNIGDVNTVADISTDVSTVADNDANVTTVATNISDVNIAATNIAAIQAAPTAAANAANSATASANSATASAASANNSHIWAEGTDAQVQALGGIHSSKLWAEQSTNANTDLSNLSAAGNDKFVTKDTAQTISGAKTFDELKTTAVLSAADDSQNVPSTSWIKDYAGVVDYSSGQEVTSSVFASSGIGYKPAVKGLLLIKTRNSVNKSYFWIYNATGTVIFNRLFNSSEGSMDVSGGTATLPLTPDFSIRVGTQAGTAGSDYWAVFYPYKA